MPCKRFVTARRPSKAAPRLGRGPGFSRFAKDATESVRYREVRNQRITGRQRVAGLTGVRSLPVVPVADAPGPSPTEARRTGYFMAIASISTSKAGAARAFTQVVATGGVGSKPAPASMKPSNRLSLVRNIVNLTTSYCTHTPGGSCEVCYGVSRFSRAQFPATLSPPMFRRVRGKVRGQT